MQHGLELEGRQVAAPQRLAGRVAEDEVIVGHAMSGRLQALRLAGPVGAQYVESRRRDLDPLTPG